MTTTTSHGQVPEALIDLIDAYAETRHRYGRIYNARTEAARNAVIEALSGVQALSAAPAIKPLVWSDESGPTDKIRYNHITAETALGQFSVEWKGWKEEDGPCVYLNGDYIGVASNLGGAKQLAERHIRELVANLLAASPTPPAEQQSTKETSGGFYVWRDISTAPKDGSRFVATGHNYGLYSEVRHTCVAQWFRGCWMEASDWNETSELKYLTHWMPLPSPPDDVAAPAEQQAAKAAPAWADQAVIEYRYTGGTHWCPLGPAERMKPDFDGVYRLLNGVFPIEQAAPKAAPTRTALPEGWTDCTIEFGNDGPEVVAYGPKRMMTRLAKWLRKYFAQVIAEAAPKAAPGVGDSGFDHQTAADFLSGKTVSDEAVRKFVATSRWAHDERAALSATLLAMHGVLTSREAEIALLKKALMEAEAAPQQEAQEPCGWTTGITWRPDTRLQSEQVIKITRDTQPKYGYTTPIYTAPQSAPAPLSDEVVKDAARYRFLAGHCRSTSEHWGGRWSIVVDGPAPKSHDSEDDFDEAVDAAIAAQGGKT